MTSPRSAPPTLSGFSHERWLGAGGFADVFLYRQSRPERHVAVKVLRARSVSATELAQFDAEANHMARVSNHPYIVQVLEVGQADDGRPYLVMEYYPQPHLGARMSSAPLAVPEVLRLGVQVASAVETAHRAGILHRDIKPANILVSEFGKPGLTDFGIAELDGGSAHQPGGMTIPYAAPEVITGSRRPGPRSDLYSLGATLYALLTGRSPWEQPDGANTEKAILTRVLHSAPPRTGRPDVPPALEHVLTQSLAKDPDHRHISAYALARALQDVERSLGLSITDLEVRVDPVPRRLLDEEPSDDRTRARVAVVAQAGPSAPAAAPSPARVQDRLRQAPPPAADATVVRRLAQAEPSHEASVPRRGRGRRLAVVGTIALAATAGGALFVSERGEAPTDRARVPTAAPADAAPDTTQGAAAPVTPATVEVVLDGDEAVVTWAAEDAQQGDQWRLKRLDVDVPYLDSATPEVVLPIRQGERPCVAVAMLRAGRLSDFSSPGCAR